MSTAAHRALRGWTVHDVVHWLKQNQLGGSAEKLKKADIDGEALGNLTELDFRQMAVPRKELGTLMKKREDLLKTDPNMVKQLMQLKGGNKSEQPPVEPPTDYPGGSTNTPGYDDEDVYSWGSDFDPDDYENGPPNAQPHNHQKPSPRKDNYEASSSDEDYLEPAVNDKGRSPAYRNKTVPPPPGMADIPVLPPRGDRGPQAGAKAEPVVPPRDGRTPGKTKPVPPKPVPKDRNQARALPPPPPETPGEVYEPFDDLPPPPADIVDQTYEETDQQPDAGDFYEDPDGPQQGRPPAPEPTRRQQAVPPVPTGPRKMSNGARPSQPVPAVHVCTVQPD